MLKITNLHAGVNGKEILKGITLEVKPGEVHAIMGRVRALANHWFARERATGHGWPGRAAAPWRVLG